MDNDKLKAESNKNNEFDLEKEKFKSVILEIKRQILSSVGKRKKIADYILELRKKNLEEYKDDEDKVAEYFNHEAFAKEEAFKIIDKRLKQLTVLDDSPYFGKVNFKDKFGECNIYIGRFGLDDETREEPIIVDWRAPISSIFYAGKLGDVSYMAPMGKVKATVLSKRQFIIKKSKFLGMFDSSMDVKDEILQMVLSQNSGDKLKDIVMTIQSEQDEIIRQPRNKAVVVNGVAGTGKTTIALHRVAYLLYNFRNVLENKVLILGPNNIFMDYISTVLPGLGEVGVKQTTFVNFALDIVKLNNIVEFKDYMEKILSGDEESNHHIIHKNSLDYIKELDSLVEKLDYGYFHIEDIKFFDKVIVSSSEIDEMFSCYFKYMPLFKRSKKIKLIIFSKIKDERDRLVRNIQKEYEKVKSKLSQEELNDKINGLIFKRKNAIRDVVGEVMEAKKRLSWLDNDDVVRIYIEFNKEKFNTDELIYDDLAPIIYLKIKLEGIKSKQDIKHIVIDEAQDYSPLQFLVIKEFTGCKSFTIVGDVNQRLIPVKGQVAMLNLENIFKDLNMDYFNLYKSYRSTQQIMSYANKYIKYNKTLPLVRNGEEVVEKQVDTMDELVDKIITDIIKFKNEGYESIAIICKNMEQTLVLGNHIKKKRYITIFSGEDVIYSSGEVIIPSYFAKGLEFDCVILINMDPMDESKQDKLKYVMATRALHELYVYNFLNTKSFD